MTLTFTSSDDKFYKVEASTDLTDWDELTDNVDGQAGETQSPTPALLQESRGHSTRYPGYRDRDDRPLLSKGLHMKVPGRRNSG